MRLRVFLISSFVFLFLGLSAVKDSTQVKAVKLVALPVVFYQPESKWGGGMAGIFRFKKRSVPDSIRYSNIIFTFTYTQLRQIVFSAPFQLWLNRENYNIYGEFGYQSENYLFFGTGNRVPASFQETYHINFPRIQVNVLKRIYPHLFAGIRYAADRNTLSQLSGSGLLIKGMIPGSSGGITSGGGAALKYDNRDNQFYTTRGYYLELSSLFYHKKLGSDYTFNKYTLNASTYRALPRRQVLAFNAYTQINIHRVPFYQMAALGGDARMRGLYDGRFRDKDCWILQAEYRAALFWRLGIAIFGGVGQVADQVNQFDLKYTHFAYGAGIRGLVDKKQHLNLRFDVGLSSGNVNYYFTFAEAF